MPKTYRILFKKRTRLLFLTIILSLMITAPDVTRPVDRNEAFFENPEILMDNYPIKAPEARQTRGAEPSEGYTLFPPMGSTDTYLIDNSGTVVHTWPSIYRPGHSAYLLDDGSIIRPANAGVGFGGGGCVQRIALNGTVVWEFFHYSDTYTTHHDVEMLPNGNVLMIACEIKNASEAIAAGRNPALLDENELWPEYVIEVEPIGLTGGNIVWEWRLWDHMIQDFDITKDNYGVVEDHPELFDINFVRNPNNALADWIHFNSIDYNEELDQILLSARHTDEIYIIDHSTTTLEAAGHSGGDSGRGGDILYRWGNPRVYRAGISDDRMLFNQHDAQWIEPGYPGEGNILIFNNGWQRPGNDYSSINEIEPPVDANGSYHITPGQPYAPALLTWTYEAPNPPDFFAFFISGCQRLPNGNTLICHGPDGHFFEVTPDYQTVWEYYNLYPSPFDTDVFKVQRYPPDHPGLENILPKLTLYEGWNLISIPAFQNSQDLTDVLDPIEGYYDAVQWYDSEYTIDQWKHHKKGKPFGNDLFGLNETMGFWIHITNPGVTNFYYHGTKPASSQTIQLHHGWNLVGYPSLTSHNRTAGLNNIVFGIDVDSMWTFKANGQIWDKIEETDTLILGSGYWIHAKNDCMWVVPL